MTNDWTVREATPDDLPAVLGVLDAAALETDRALVEASIDRGTTLVAVRATSRDASAAAGATDDIADGTVLGALVLAGDEIEAVAVRRRLRGQGIGTSLVDAAATRRDRLIAEFDASVRPFYESRGFETVPLDEPERYRGRKPADGG